MEELCIPDGSDLIGKELRYSGIRSDYNLIIVAIRRRDGGMIYNPSPELVLEPEDILVAIGPQENLTRFMGQLYEKVPYCSVRTFHKNGLTKGN
jgi:voltage-gated potassium channel